MPDAALKEKVDALDAEIASTKQQAGEAWTKFDEKRKALAASDVDITDESSEEFQAAHELHQQYGEKADKVETLQDQREKLWAMMAENGSEGDRAARQVREHVKDGLHSRESYGARVIGSQAYQTLRDSGALQSTAALGRVELGQMMKRDELIAALQLNAAVIVTDDAGEDTVRPFIEPKHRGLIEPRFRPLKLLDLISVAGTDTDSIDYVVETGWVNNAAVVPEAQTDAKIGGEVTTVKGGVKPQSKLSFEKKSASVEQIAHWIAATRKTLRNAPQVRGIIDNRLSRGLLEKLEDEIIAGSGVGDHLLGFLNTPGIQHQDRNEGDPLVDDILRALTRLRLAFFDTGLVVGLNPLDAEEVRLSKDKNGNYIFGPPSQAGPSTYWGVPGVEAAQFPQEQPVAGDFSVVELYIQEGVTVLASDSHEDFFTRNLVAVLAEMAAVSVVPQPEGLCEISPAP
jgi:HK97 family phage major capsid protein